MVDALTPTLSVVIPLAESSLPDRWPDRLLGDETPNEVVVAARADVPGALLARLKRRGCRVLQSDAPRGARLRTAAATTRSRSLLFLHCDTQLPDGWHDLACAALGRGRVWGAFRLSFTVDQLRLRCISWGANLRSRLLGLPFGDQAPFVSRDVYERVGGHPPWPLLDDLELARRLKRVARPLILSAAVSTSPRRYHRHGPWRTVVRNSRVLCGYALGQSPEQLRRIYGDDPGPQKREQA